MLLFRMNGWVMEICLKFRVILDYGGGVWAGRYFLVVIYNQMLMYSVIMAEKNVEDSLLIFQQFYPQRLQPLRFLSVYRWLRGGQLFFLCYFFQDTG